MRDYRDFPCVILITTRLKDHSYAIGEAPSSTRPFYTFPLSLRKHARMYFLSLRNTRLGARFQPDNEQASGMRLPEA